jgi:NAD(P)-dependent dehydrogenase (short-subunit alcohol dehydrogenase family)
LFSFVFSGKPVSIFPDELQFGATLLFTPQDAGMPMPLLDDKTCIITGGAGSIGLATARLFLDEGANVVLIDRDRDGLERVAADLPPERVALAAADVTDAESTRSYVSHAVSRFGGIDVLFSNAGTFGTVAPIAEYPEEIFDAVQAVHVKGAFLAAKYAAPHMRRGGSIVITSSVAATRGDPGVYAYITAKHAQTGLMRCLAKELAPRGIRVNTVNPGPVDNGFQLAVEKGLGEAIGADGTEFFNAMIPMGRHAHPDEIARSVLYLASAQSSFVTGTMLMVDGGMSI